MTKPLVLVDGSSYLFRAYHALPPLTNQDGEPTGAIYGVVNMLKRLLADYEPSHCCVVFDAKGKTFRNDMYPEYKANRGAMPDDLVPQVEPLLQLIEALGFPLIRITGVEADDVIGTLAVNIKDVPIVISTGDKDLAQLVNERVTLVNTMSGTELDIAGVIDKFGVPPERIIDYLTLIGDTSDNIPGVPKVGPKTAVKWLTQFNDLDTIIARHTEIKGKVGENLKNTLEQLPLSKKLVTIKTDVELAEGYDDLILKQPDLATLKTLYTRFEFKNWLRDLEQDGAPAQQVAEVVTPTNEYEVVLDAARLDHWASAIAHADIVCIDTETTSLNTQQAKLVGLSIAVEPGKAAYIPIAHNYEGAPKQLSKDIVLDVLGPWLQDENSKKLGHNLKYDLSILCNNGIPFAGIHDDTMLASYILNSVSSRHDLDTLSLKHLNQKTTKFEEIAGKGVKQVTFDQIDIQVAGDYACEDVDMSLQLYQLFSKQLQQFSKVEQVYRDIEVPLISVLSKMERTGVMLDVDKLVQQSAWLHQKIESAQKLIFMQAGEEFNIDSPKQLQKILFEKLNLPILAKTPKGQPSTAESVLSELALEHELPQIILDYRSLSKLKSTYTDKLPTLIDPETGRLHTSYHQAVTATGRLSSSDPNLQNIPIRREEGRLIRQAFIVPNGYKMLAADYSQIELRIMAHLSGDKGLLDAFARGDDIHRATAAEVFGVDKSAVSSDQRRSAKAINFGLIYGMSAFGLAKQLSVPRDAAQSYIDTYFARYPGVADYMERTREFAKQHGYVETVLGRRLYLPEIHAKQRQRVMAAERAAINAPMQGTAADIIKRAMLGCQQWIDTEAQHVKLLLQVHDELVFEVPETEITSAKEKITGIMEQALSLSVPLLVEVGVGDNWEQAH